MNRTPKHNQEKFQWQDRVRDKVYVNVNKQKKHMVEIKS